MLKLQKCCNQRSPELASKEIRQYKYISTFYIFYHTMNYEPGILQETHSSVNSLSDVTQSGITSVPISSNSAKQMLEIDGNGQCKMQALL